MDKVIVTIQIEKAEPPGEYLRYREEISRQVDIARFIARLRKNVRELAGLEHTLVAQKS